MKKENIMPVVVLTVICLVSALILGAVNMIAAPIIEAAKNDAAYAALKDVLPEGKNFKEVEITSEMPKEITRAYSATGGYVFEATVTGNHTGMIVMCGIGTDGKVIGVKVIANEETPGFWSTVEPIVTGLNGAYTGKDASNLSLELVSGATNSSTGVYNAVKAALTAYAHVSGGEAPEDPGNSGDSGDDIETLPKTDAEIIAFAEALLGAEAGTLADVTPDEITDVKRVYRDSSKNNYAVYTVVMSQYGTVETETLIHIGSDGVVKGTNKLTWKTSDAMYGYVPPTEAEVNPFYENLIGKDSDTIGSVELVTNATNTSTSLRNAVSEAIKVVNALVKNDLPTPVEEVKSLAAELLGVSSEALVDVTPDETDLVKKVFRDNSAGYAIYTVVMSRYGTVETETIIHVGFDGAIKGTKKMVWKTSDAMYGYVPPTEAEVNPFYDRLVGATSETIGDVELVTNATNTSTALVGAISEALNVAKELIKVDMPTAKDTVKDLAAELLGVEVGSLTNVTPEGCDLVKKVYYSSEKGYAVYTVVMSRYGYPETETIVYIGTDGTIKGVKKMVWKTSDAMYGYVPPTEAEVNPFYDRLVGATSETIEDVELVTNATNTSTALVGAIAEALDVVNDLIKNNDIPTNESEIKNLAAELMGCEVDSLSDVTPADGDFVKRIYRDSVKGYAVYTVVMSRYGYPETETIVYVGTDGTIKGVKKMVWKTSDAMYGYVPPTEAEVNPFYDRLVGANLTNIDSVELVTNATNTSTGLINAIKEGLNAVKEISRNDLPTPEDEIKNLVAELLGTEIGSLSDVTPADGEFVKRIYRDSSKGYAVYTVVMSQYGTVETETIIHIGTDGSIKGIKKMVWKTSDAMYGYVPPTEAEVNPFYDRLVGTNLTNIDSVELVTNATNTSTALLNAIKEALESVEELSKENLPTPEEDVKKIAAELMGVDYGLLSDVTPSGTKLVKRVYSDSEKGYAVYLVVISENYGTVETETIIHVGFDGAIKGIKKMVWKTSDAIYGYVPPTESEVNPFYDRLVGANLTNIDSVELVTNATNTSTGLINAITEAFNVIEGFDNGAVPEESQLPRIVGIVILAASAFGVIAYVAVKAIIRRKRR